MSEQISPKIIVDEIRKWPHARGVFRRGACHLTVDGETPRHIEALHDFAQRIGLKRSWFQKKSTPHYDLTIGKRAEALAAGAVEVGAMEQARQWIDRRSK